MRVVILPDKFKGTLSSQAVADAMHSASRSVFPTAEVLVSPMADGGEGSSALVASQLGAVPVVVETRDALSRPVRATYYITQDGESAIMELAAASGLQLIEPELRDAMRANTYGLGEMIANADGRGVRQIFVFIGGSASTDGGTGAASAYGTVFRNKRGEVIPRLSGATLLEIDACDRKFPKARVIGVCDVKNPLCGVDGAAFVYAPQKGATREEVARLDLGLKHLSDVVGADYAAGLGMGAAGGTGFGLVAFFNAELVPGTETILQHLGLSEAVADADLLITGEGRFDQSSMDGKLVGELLNLRKGKPTIVVCGQQTMTISSEAAIVRSLGDQSEGAAVAVELATRDALHVFRSRFHKEL